MEMSIRVEKDVSSGRIRRNMIYREWMRMKICAPAAPNVFFFDGRSAGVHKSGICLIPNSETLYDRNSWIYFYHVTVICGRMYVTILLVYLGQKSMEFAKGLTGIYNKNWCLWAISIIIAPSVY